MNFTVAIVGRPNVGKSTLFNRLTGTAFALVHDEPGVTRDRREGRGNIGPLEFIVYDTAGLEEADEGTLAARMTRQTQSALKGADVVLMVVDGRAGITPEDAHFAKLIRRSGRPVILLVNKSEGAKAQATVADAYRLGLGDPVAISAAHGEGMGDLYEALAPFDLTAHDAEEDPPEKKRRKRKKNERDIAAAETEAAALAAAEHEDEKSLIVAIVGRPNAGKSTLMNAILGEDRVLTGPEAGITRDAIAVEHLWNGTPVRLVDTAGMRRRSSVVEKLERLSVSDSLRAIQYAHVVVLMVDAHAPLEKQDNTLSALVEREGRGLVVAVNKWDTVQEPQRVLKDIHERLEIVLSQLRGVPVVPISALAGKHLDRLRAAILKTHELWNRHIPTAALNRWLEDALARHAPPLVNGRRLKFRYAVQHKTRPPTILLFTNMVRDVPEHYLRYLSTSLRSAFDLPGIPIRIVLRKSKNPYADGAS